MTDYRVTVNYHRPSGTETTVTVEVEANGPRHAIQRAKRWLLDQPLRKVSSWGRVSALPLKSEPVLPDPIQNGEFISIPRKPIEGKVELLPNGFVKIHKAGGGQVVCSRPQVEEATGRPVAPRPPKVTIEVLVLYPNGNVYQSDRRYQTSQYGVENLVQVKITKHDGVIVAKEFV